MFDLQSILLIIVTIANLGLAIFIYFKNRKSQINISFAVFAFFVSLWALSLFLFRIIDILFIATYLMKWSYITALFIGASFYYFSIVFPKNILPSRYQKLLLLIPTSIFFLLLLLPNFLVENIIYHPWGKEIILGKIEYWLFLFYFIGFFIGGLTRGWIKYRKTYGIAKKQLLYVVMSVSIAGFFGMLFNLFLPSPFLKSWQLIWLGPLFTSLIVLAIAYAIIRYRLMDIRVAVKRSTIFSGIVIAVTASYALTAFLLGLVIFGGVYTLKAQFIIGLIVAVLVAFGFRPLYEWLKRTTDAYLFKGDYKPQKLLADISDVLSRTLDLDRVIKTLREKIISTLRVGEMEVVVLEENEINQGQPSQSRPLQGRDFQGSPLKNYSDSHESDSHGIVSSSSSATPHNDRFKKFIDYFKKQRDVLVLEELQRRYADRTKFDKSFLLIKEMEKFKTALMVPLFLKDKLVGLFLLSAKKSGDMFTNEDIKTLETIASQAAIAIENSRLYEEMKDFSKTLQKEVDKQTKTLKEANIKLEQLDKAKSEFISIASHQLRTPLSVIKGYVSMMLEGLWGEVSPEQKRHLEMVYLSNERLIKLIEDLLMVSRIEAGRLEFNFQMISLSDIAESVVNELKSLADKKGLYLNYEKPKTALPKVKADPLKIRQVVMNLIDNAIHYTEKGGATVRLKQEKDKIILSIKDTGVGIPEKEKLTLFEKFSRGKEISKLHTEGTGLGLYLAAKLVNAHNGKIWAESEGEDKGSTFYFELGEK